MNMLNVIAMGPQNRQSEMSVVVLGDMQQRPGQFLHSAGGHKHSLYSTAHHQDPTIKGRTFQPLSPADGSCQ